jgi:anaerobic magnesium-protoporphyrin IX monomethyl ester cyclase
MELTKKTGTRARPANIIHWYRIKRNGRRGGYELSRKVVLFLPPYAGGLIGPPLSLLSLAGSLREDGFDPCIIDGALKADYLESIEQEIQDCLCFGVSLLTGPMIDTAITVARHVKRLRPDLPVIFGGWHPSLLPAQTLREPYVDAIVLHQGELTLLEVARRLADGKSLDLVAGCWYKKGGHIHQNPDRPSSPLSKLPKPAYDLADFDAYEARSGERTLPYASSVGCPYECTYCTDTVFYNRRFNAYTARQVAEEMTEMTQRFRLRKIALVDSNFLVNTRRAADIARALIESGANVEWSFQASTDLLCRMTDADVEALAESGVGHIGFGTESASETVLQKMKKFHQTVPDMYEAARKCQCAKIRVTYNLILGYPGETETDRLQTMRVMSDINDKFDNVNFSPNVFTPYPGIPIWPELRKLGIKEPESLAEWAQVDLKGNVLPWLRGRTNSQLRRSISYLLLKTEVTKAAKSQSPAKRLLFKWFQKPLAWRIKSQCLHWPLELWAASARRRLVLRRSLLTGRKLA